MKLKLDAKHQVAALGLSLKGRFAIRFVGDGTRALVGGLMSFGRSYGQLILPDDPEISRGHGVIFEDAGRLFLQDDANVTNSTRINGKAITPGKPALVPMGATIEIGQYAFVVEPVPVPGVAVTPAFPPLPSDDIVPDGLAPTPALGASLSVPPVRRSRASLGLVIVLLVCFGYGYYLTQDAGSLFPNRQPAAQVTTPSQAPPAPRLVEPTQISEPTPAPMHEPALAPSPSPSAVKARQLPRATKPKPVRKTASQVNERRLPKTLPPKKPPQKRK